jgi:uncharacterized membrane protein YccC
MTRLVQPVVLRNAVVLALAAGLVSVFQLKECLFLVLAVLLTVQGSIGKGLVAGRERIVGTLCGTAACLLVLGLLRLPGVPAAGLGLGLVRVLGHGLGLGSGFIVGGHVVAGSVAHHSADWPAYVALRSLETLAGVLVGMVAARWILPVRASHQLQLAIDRWQAGLAEAVRAAEPAPTGLQLLRDCRNRLLDDLSFAREELPHEARARDLAAQWDRKLFHGAALLGCLRDLGNLQPLAALTPAESERLAATCREVMDRSADRLGGSPDGTALQAATRRLAELCAWLDRQQPDWSSATLDQLALRLQRTRLIAHHTEAFVGQGQAT